MILFESLYLYVNMCRQDAEVEGYFGEFLNLTWDQLREIEHEEGSGPHVVTFVAKEDGKLYSGFAWVGTYPGMPLDEVRVGLLSNHLQETNSDEVPWWDELPHD